MRTKSQVESRKTATLKDKRPDWIRIILFLLVPCSLFLSSCGSEAHYETTDVEVRMDIKNISAGFVECDFSTNKDAYYLISIMEPWEDYDPMANQKQFMQLALDSAYAEYLQWRNELLKEKEFNVAPFASHSLQYGDIDHFFTGLYLDREYWIFAFPVDPISMKPAGRLVLQTIKTSQYSLVDIRFDYRIKGEWDYIYPTDTLGNINSRYPYIAITEDSATIAQDTTVDGEAKYYFLQWETEMFLYPEKANVYYGVKAIENNGEQSHLEFEEGHTYYTGITGFNGLFKRMTIYKFTWTKDCEYYFHDTDSTNLAILYDYYMGEK